MTRENDGFWDSHGSVARAGCGPVVLVAALVGAIGILSVPWLVVDAPVSLLARSAWMLGVPAGLGAFLLLFAAVASVFGRRQPAPSEKAKEALEGLVNKYRENIMKAAESFARRTHSEDVQAIHIWDAETVLRSGSVQWIPSVLMTLGGACLGSMIQFVNQSLHTKPVIAVTATWWAGGTGVAGTVLVAAGIIVGIMRRT